MAGMSSNTPISGLFSVSGPRIRYHGPAVLLRAAVAVLSPPTAQQVLATGLERSPNRYWLVAGPADGSADGIFTAPVERLRIAEEPDGHSYHPVAVQVRVDGWSGVPSEASITNGQCTSRDATYLSTLLADAPDLTPGWLAGAIAALHVAEAGAATGAATTRPFPSGILPPDGGGIDQGLHIWPLWP
jgi:hypothetical protein